VKASKKLKEEVIAVVLAVFIIVAGAFLVKNYIFGEKPKELPKEEKIAEKPSEEIVKEVVLENKAYAQKITADSIKIVETETNEPVASVQFKELKTNITHIPAKIIKPDNPAFKSEIFAVKDAEFSEAKITLKKTGRVDAIFYCSDFDFENNTCNSGWQKTDIPFTQTEDSVTFTVSHFSAYVAGVNTTLLIYAYSRSPNEQIYFYAEYKNSSNNWQINDSFANLTINFSDSVSGNMTFNSSSQRWEYNRSFSAEGTYFYTINTSSSIYENLGATDNVTVFNCSVPHDDFYINNDVEICPGVYNLTDNGAPGILIVNSSNISVNCNFAVNYYNVSVFFGAFFYSSGFSNVTFKNCNLSAPQKGLSIRVENGENLSFSNITNLPSSGTQFSGVKNLLADGLYIVAHSYPAIETDNSLSIYSSENVTILNSYFSSYYRNAIYLENDKGINLVNITANDYYNYYSFFSNISNSNIISFSHDGSLIAKNLINVSFINSSLLSGSSYYMTNFSNLTNSTFFGNTFQTLVVNGSNLNFSENSLTSSPNKRLRLKVIGSVYFYNLTFQQSTFGYIPSSVKYDSLLLSDADISSSNFIFDNNFIYVNGSNNYLNQSAVLTFYNLSWTTTPQLFKDGVRCDDNPALCNITSYNPFDGTLEARVASFSNYTTANGSTCFNVTDDLYINKDATICDGTYYVNDTNDDGIIIINKSGTSSDPLTVTFGNTIIQGNNSGKGIVAENRSYIQLYSPSNGVSLYNFSEAVHFKNIYSCELTAPGTTSSVLENNDVGLMFNNVSNCYIYRMSILYKNNGVILYSGNNNTLDYLSVSGNGTGINITNSNDNNLILGAQWTGANSNLDYGILITNSSRNKVHEIKALSNGIGISLQNTHNTTIESSYFSYNNKGIYSNNSDGLSINFSYSYPSPFDWSGNNISIELQNSSAKIQSFTIKNGTAGIQLINSAANITNINFINNTIGIIVNQSQNVSILSNNISSSHINLYLSGADNVNISDNSITGISNYDFYSEGSNATISIAVKNPLFSDANSRMNASNLTFFSENASINYKNMLINETVNTSTGFYLLWNLSGLDPSISPGLNKTATITLYSLIWPSTPFVTKDGVRCDNTSDCTIISYDNVAGTLVFNVTGFSNYSSSNPNLPGTPDTEPPTEPTVYDGLNFIDYNWTASNTTLFGSWNGSFDRSNIFYSYRIIDSNGSCLGGCTLKFVGSAQQVTVSNLSLSACHTYHFEVEAQDTFYNTANISSSDGITVDMEAPTLLGFSSQPHPSQYVYYKTNTVQLNWTANDTNLSGCASGVAGYSYLLDQDSGSFPDEFIETNETNITFSNVPNGVWYFHIRAVDFAGNAGDTLVRTIRINATPVTVTLNPVETPTLLKNATIFGTVTENSSNKLFVYKNDFNIINISIAAGQTNFNFTVNLTLGMNAIYANASINNSIVAKSNTLYINRLNESRLNVTGFTVSYSGGSLTDSSASNLISTSSATANYGIGKSSGKLFIFVTTPDADTATRAQYVTNNTFFEQVNPSVGFPFGIEQNLISTILSYQDLSIAGNQSVQTGRYTLVITNNGTINGAPQIVVKIT